MDWLRKIPMASLAIVVGAISAIAWIVLDGTLPLVISIIAGSLIALRATLGDDNQWRRSSGQACSASTVSTSGQSR